MRISRLTASIGLGAALALASAGTATANNGNGGSPGDPINYGQCVSAAAQGTLFDFTGTPSDFNALFDPPKSNGGNGVPTACLTPH